MNQVYHALLLLVHLLSFRHASSRQFGHSLKWLAIATTNMEPDACDQLYGLNKRQRKLCTKFEDVMPYVVRGAQMTISECQHQFADRRWNCSAVEEKNIFGSVMEQGSREAAFLHAMTSAALSHSITRACSQGTMPDRCSCDKSVRGPAEGFMWAGCSDNIAYGNTISKRFMDAREKPTKSMAKWKDVARFEKILQRMVMNLHNNEAGRQTLHDTMQVGCKCHGMSGSCDMKTCWRKVSNFRKIGDTIKEKFDGATEVVVHSTARGRKRRFVMEPLNPHTKRHTKSDLVYIEPSPDFCKKDDKTGSLGTKGRICDADSPGIDGCKLMCCGRAFTTIRRKVTKKCNCKFVWCCNVQCDECEEEEAISTCN